MNNSRALLWITLLIVLAGIFAGVWYANHHVEKTATTAPVVGTAKLGQPAPEFQAATTQGLFDLDKATQPVFLEVFATWCPHCQRETSIIDLLYENYKHKVDFVAVTGSQYGMDRNTPASEEDTARYVERFHAEYPVAYDPTMGVAKAYLQGGYPTLVVIGRDKKVTYITSGETTYAELDGAIKQALK